MVSLANIRASITERGTAATFGDLAYRAVRRVADVHVLRAMTLTPQSLADASSLAAAPELRWGFLDAPALLELATRGGDVDMDLPFVHEAMQRGDRCFAALDGDVLASAGWYSTLPTPVADGLDLWFAPDWAYMYKGYTAHAYRGRRLHGIGMARAMAAYVDEGYRGLISYVDAANIASLKSCARLGYVTFGTALAVRVGDRWWTHATKDCADYRFELRPANAGRGRTAPAAERSRNQRAASMAG